MDEKLEKVLYQIVLLCEQYPEFKGGLMEKLKMTSPTTKEDLTPSGEKIDKIEKYLSLDYRVDNLYPLDTIYDEIDYALNKEKDTLLSDFREMMRYRYATRPHEKENFYEYCRCAHYQLETLVNAYISCICMDENSDDDVLDVKQTIKFIQTNWPTNLPYKPNFRDKLKYVTDFDYFQKMAATIHYLGIESVNISKTDHIWFSVSDITNFIRAARNDMSHRGSSHQQAIDKAIEKYEKNKKLDEKGLYIFNDSNIKYYYWIKLKRWEDVVKTIAIVNDAMQKNIAGQ